jgi:putative protease
VSAINKNLVSEDGRRKKAGIAPRKRGRGRSGTKWPLYIKIDDLQALKLRLPIVPELFIVELNRKSFTDSQRLKKIVKKFRYKIAWSLPPVIMENEMDFFMQSIRELLKNNFRTWQIAHIGQRLFFTKKDRVNLLGDYTLNILNSMGMFALSTLNIKRTQVAIETDKKSLADLTGSKAAEKAGIGLGMTLYGRPPLFTARPMASHFQYDKTFVSPRGESFFLSKAYNSTVALAENPFSLLSRLAELKVLGVQYGVIDLCHRKIERREIDEIGRELAGKGARKKLSTFNYFGDLL